jgi:hypothetical protein
MNMNSCRFRRAAAEAGRHLASKPHLSANGADAAKFGLSARGTVYR